jgi:hypothetical protein
MSRPNLSARVDLNVTPLIDVLLVQKAGPARSSVLSIYAHR